MSWTPGGGETNRSSNEAFEPKKYTSYVRDANGSDDAMHRRYSRWHSRFDQPDPYDGSYSLTNPQSFNRYAYVQNDPVNFVDPSGLDGEFTCQVGDPQCVVGSVNVPIPGSGSGSSGGVPGGGGGNEMVPEDLPPTGGPGGVGGGGGGRGGGSHEAGHSQGFDPNAACDNKLAGIFGGLGAVVGSTHDPRTLLANAGALSYYARTGLPVPANFGSREPGHGPTPYPQGRGSDKGGIIHIYGNGQGTARNAGLFAPSGGTVSGMFPTANRNTQINVSYNGGPYAGLTIAFVHVSAGSGGPNDMGSVRIGNIGGPGGNTYGNIHTHAVFYMNGNRIDPRTIFCKEFGF